MNKIRKYEILKISVGELKGAGLVAYCGILSINGKEMKIPAFKISENAYMIYFMPNQIGLWSYMISWQEKSIIGEFECVEAADGQHGMVVVKGEGFAYADGSRYIPFGTTCYAWTNQVEELQKATLETLAAAPFNKIRMCIFPKSMPYNQNNPEIYPFLKDAAGNWDVKMLDYRFWDNLEERLALLLTLGIQADLILFHPYDRWGFANLSQEDSLEYLEYCIARFSAYPNIWWSLANEYEMLYDKKIADWDEYGETILKRDPYHHLTSIHNIMKVYPKRNWMTHCSIQSGNIHNILNWKMEYQIPVVIDECGYEGDLPYNWGNLSAFEMVHRFWWTICRGGYCTHGETFHREDEVLWWAKGGRLYGQSADRIRFLKEILYSLPEKGQVSNEKFMQNPNVDASNTEAVKQEQNFQDLISSLPEYQKKEMIFNIPMDISNDHFILRYFGRSCPCYTELALPDKGSYQVEIIDIWEMTRTVAAEQVSKDERIFLPGKEGIAVLATRKYDNLLV